MIGDICQWLARLDKEVAVAPRLAPEVGEWAGADDLYVPSESTQQNSEGIQH